MEKRCKCGIRERSEVMRRELFEWKCESEVTGTEGKRSEVTEKNMWNGKM